VLAPVWIDRLSVWDKELKPGNIRIFNEVAPVKYISSIKECMPLRISIHIQTGREFPGIGPGQDRKQVMNRAQRIAFRLRDFIEKKAITME